jgi:hypothetical protein
MELKGRGPTSVIIPTFSLFEKVASLRVGEPTIWGLIPDMSNEFILPEARGFLSKGVKQPGREGDYSPPTSVKFRNDWSYTSNLSISVVA